MREAVIFHCDVELFGAKIKKGKFVRQKEWVGLNEDETDGLIHSATYMDETDLWHLVSLVEERLKEKNGG